MKRQLPLPRPLKRFLPSTLCAHLDLHACQFPPACNQLTRPERAGLAELTKRLRAEKEQTANKDVEE